ncbi:MAG TPA: nuclear transport factor 2 family protein [Vicinamibacterales bacterium]|nr:nuclear transport factor 2 family protein [Vicinamibacterales bacterium]
MAKLLTQLPFMIALATTTASGIGQRPAADADWKASLLAAREAAWRHYYGDSDKLAAMLPNDFIAMGLGGRWGNKTETVASSRADIAAGTSIASLKFPETRIQRYGDAAIIYTTFEMVLSKNGQQQPPIVGRGTEIFRWDGAQWLHPGWHLDSGR